MTEGEDRAHSPAAHTHRDADGAVVTLSHPTGNRVADALIAGFLHGIGRQPWADMHDYIAICAVNYVKGEPLPARRTETDINWKAEWEAVCFSNIQLANAARPFADVAIEFSACGDGQPIGIKAASGRSDLSVGDLRALATALTNMGPARCPPPKEAEPWRPIETAPEKEELLVCVTHNLGDDEWETVQWVDFRIERQGWVHYRNLIHVPFPPTHWMPLPSPPDQKKGA